MKTEYPPSLLEGRVTSGRFHPSFTIGTSVIRELIRLATQAPSAFNLQNWSFIAVHSAPAKRKLQALAFGQEQIRDAAATLIICGTLEAHSSLEAKLQASVDAGILSSAVQQTWVAMASTAHRNNPRLQRDEAIRSASLACMALLVAAKEQGLDTGVIGGFDSEGVREAFELSPLELPVALVPIGRATSRNWAQKIRQPVEQVLRFA